MHRGMLLDAESGAVVVARVLRTTTPWERLRGLLGRAPLGAGDGLLLDPCGSIHTLFMTDAIDVIHLDRAGTVTRIVAALPPWRASLGFGTAMMLELAAGAAARAGLRRGQRLRWRQHA